MYAIWHIRPHSPFSRFIIATKSAIAHLSLDSPGLLCLRPCCRPSCICVTQLTLFPAYRFSNRQVTSHSPAGRYTGCISLLSLDALICIII